MFICTRLCCPWIATVYTHTHARARLCCPWIATIYIHTRACANVCSAVRHGSTTEQITRMSIDSTVCEVICRETSPVVAVPTGRDPVTSLSMFSRYLRCGAMHSTYKLRGCVPVGSAVRCWQELQTSFRRSSVVYAVKPLYCDHPSYLDRLRSVTRLGWVWHHHVPQAE